MIGLVPTGELIQRCLTKEPWAWQEFLKRYNQLIYWAIYDRLKRTGSPAFPSEVGDIFQEVILRLWEKEKLRQLRNPETLIAWLTMVAGNTAIEFMRKKVPEDPVDPLEGASLAAESPVHHEEEDLSHLVEELLAMLSPRDQAVLRLYYLHEKSYKEITSLLGIPINTVGTILARAKGRLREELKKRGIEKI